MVVVLELPAGDGAGDAGAVGAAVGEDVAGLLLAVLGLRAHVLHELDARLGDVVDAGPGEQHQRHPARHRSATMNATIIQNGGRRSRGSRTA